MKIYRVGGAIRDRILKLKAKDSDYVVVGSTEGEMIEKGFKRLVRISQFSYILKQTKNMRLQERKEI